MQSRQIQEKPHSIYRKGKETTELPGNLDSEEDLTML